MDGRIWLPGLRWRKANSSLRGRLERLFSVPMIFIALAILPVLLIEFGMRQQVLDAPLAAVRPAREPGRHLVRFRRRVHRDVLGGGQETEILQGTLDRHRHHPAAVHLLPPLAADRARHARGAAWHAWSNWCG